MDGKSITIIVVVVVVLNEPWLREPLCSPLSAMREYDDAGYVTLGPSLCTRRKAQCIFCQ